jgi:CheY-like chemotaxis protein
MPSPLSAAQDERVALLQAFLATMSHEIRTPMNGVIGAVELLERSSLTRYQRGLVDTVRDSANALMALIDGILDFSKIEAGRLDVERAPLPLRGLLESACDALQPLAMARGVHVHLFVDPALPDEILGDAVRLRQVMTNLLGNAIKFSAGLERPGRVALRAVRADARTLRISIADNGIGLSPDAQARLFQPFVQADCSTTRRYGGTGLGLAICDRLTRAMGGRIGVESAPDAGARFDVELPMAPVAAPSRSLRHDLAGVSCELFVGDEMWADDWAAYLQAAGARPAEGAAEEAVRVLVVQIEQLVHLYDRPGAADCPRVELHHGRRRQPRALGVPGAPRVVLDVEGLHRDALVHAVAMAAGLAAPVAADSATLPLDAFPVPADAERAAAQSELVLVAEDNPINRMVLEQQLALLGVAAVFADDGLDALRQWREGPERFGLLLTDLHMPGLDGFALAAAIRADEASLGGRRLPIVALTASALRDEDERCRMAGMDDVVVKPVLLEPLGEAVRRWLALGAIA